MELTTKNMSYDSFNTTQSSSLVISPESLQFSESELNFHFWFYKVVIPTLYSIIVVVGTIGNIMVIFVICARSTMRTTVNVLLLNLACSDLLFLVVCVPFVTYHFAADDWAFGDLICKLSQFLLYVTVYVTMYTLVLIATVRYLTIVYPRSSARWRTKRTICCTVGIVWAVMLLINIPILLIHRVKSYPAGNSRFAYSYCGLESTTTGQRLFVPFFLFTYVIPLILISALYLLVVRFLHKSKTSSFNLKSSDGDTTRRDTSISITHIEERTLHATRILVCVVVVFAICWLPLHIHLLTTYFAQQPQSRMLQVYRGLSHFLAYANSAMNPIIYNYVSRDFRTSFRQMFTSGCCSLSSSICSHKSTSHTVDGGIAAAAATVVVTTERVTKRSERDEVDVIAIEEKPLVNKGRLSSNVHARVASEV